MAKNLMALILVIITCSIFAPISNATEQQEAQLRSERLRKTCPIPLVPKGSMVVLIGAYEGSSVSTVSIAGQNKTTSAIKIEIKPADQNIYLILNSYESVIWQISGATERVKNLVLLGPSLDPETNEPVSGNGTVNAGVTGIGHDIIKFENTLNCDMIGFQNISIDRDKMQQILNHAIDAYVGDESPIGFSIESASATLIKLHENVEQPHPPLKYDPEAWKEFLNFKPGGLAQIDASSIVAESSIEPYEVMPNWAGMAQLIGQGTVLPVYNTKSPVMIYVQGQEAPKSLYTRVPAAYKIVKDIPYYPADLYGASSTTFILANSVKSPVNSAGHSTVLTEADWQKLESGQEN